MKRVLAWMSLVLLAGCASDGYYSRSYPAYGYGGYHYYDDGWRPYAYDGGFPYYYYDYAPGILGGFYYYDRDRDRDHRRRDRDERHRGDVERAPAQRMDPGNQVRPGAGRVVPPGEMRHHGEPNSGMTPEQSLGAAGR